jgi:hypothetical protein
MRSRQAAGLRIGKAHADACLAATTQVIDADVNEARQIVCRALAGTICSRKKVMPALNDAQGAVKPDVNSGHGMAGVPADRLYLQSNTVYPYVEAIGGIGVHQANSRFD